LRNAWGSSMCSMISHNKITSYFPVKRGFSSVRS
jgi:hypothetical protein